MNIDSSAKNLLIIVNDILDFSKIEAGKLTIEKINFDMKKLMEGIENLIIESIHQKNLSFSLEYNCNQNSVCYGDSLRISQILINLISNAIKFTKEGSIKVTLTRINEDRVKFEIRDTGVGISKEEQKKLFIPFSQANRSTTRKYGGTGLGLSISKQLVEQMDGEIWVESQEESGSKFIFEIELKKGDISKIQIETKENLNLNLKYLKNSHILLVEDNLINQEIVVGLLEESGIHIDIANNGQEAVELSSSTDKYELILMDLQMPVMNGYEASKIIRQRDKNIPIIALTANAMLKDVERTLKAGMNEHLNKPIEVEKLYEILSKYIPQKREILNDEIQTDGIKIPKFQYIESATALKYLAGNKKLYLKILANFKNTYSDFKIDTLNQEEFKRVIHTLKGISANIGATELHLKVKEVDETQNRDLIYTIYEEMKKVLEDLTLLKTEDKKETTALLELSDARRVALFKELKEFAQRSRTKKCKTTLKELEKYRLNTQDKKVLEKIQEFINQYNYTDALLLLQEISPS
jgi:CheY-like chemotaxis protein/anti-sigma regulatory factor (Ser/Thr protein kinase)